jgi:hypothetical protein
MEGCLHMKKISQEEFEKMYPKSDGESQQLYFGFEGDDTGAELVTPCPFLTINPNYAMYKPK